MDNYKCPICGNDECVEADILSTDTECKETVFYKQNGNLYKGERLHAFSARGLVNYKCSARSNDANVEVILLYKNNCTTKVCTKCGFVSFHALNVAQGILQDQIIIEKQIEEATNTKNVLNDELEGLKVEQNNLPKKIAEIEAQLQDENITIKKQKELQILLEETKQREKKMSTIIKDKEQDIKIIEARIGFFSNSSDCISGHKIAD